MKIVVLSIYFLLLFLFATGQQNNIWYFGSKVGLNFNATSPAQAIPISDNNSVMTSAEGSSSICDDNGNILFYTNGVTVYNKDHHVMQNGTGLNGNESAVQSSLIIQQPGNDSLFYIFTTDAIENFFANGYCYSIVNMKLDNGRGAVISKNNLLWSSCTERLTAARHANGIDVWIITNDNKSNTFRSWLLTCNGLQMNPVVSVQGNVLNNNNFMDVGMMKVSPDGKKLCQTFFPELGSDSITHNYFQLFDFNNSTGELSNPKAIADSSQSYRVCAFSNNSSLLYLVHFFGKQIDQFDISLNSIPVILASRYSFNADRNYYGIERGPDQKLYLCAPNTSLAVIAAPDARGSSCNFQPQKISQGNGFTQIGLPNYINDASFDQLNNFTYSTTGTCSGQVQFTATTNLGGTVTWQWDFGDGNTSSQQNPLHIYSNINQTYKIVLIIQSNLTCGRKITITKYVSPTGSVSNPDFSVTVRCDTVFCTNLYADSTNPANSFTWDFDDGNTSSFISPTHIYQRTGNYNITLHFITTPSCLSQDISHPVSINTFSFIPPPSQTILIGKSINLVVNGAVDAKYSWTPATWLSSNSGHTVTADPLHDTTYYITGIKNGCTHTDSTKVQVIQLNAFYVPSAFTPNGDGLNDEIKPWFGEKIILKRFTIYDRWGNIVFTTTKRNTGWNGCINGMPQSTNSYVWSAEIINEKSTPTHLNGVLTLIR